MGKKGDENRKEALEEVSVDLKYFKTLRGLGLIPGLWYFILCH